MVSLYGAGQRKQKKVRTDSNRRPRDNTHRGQIGQRETSFGWFRKRGRGRPNFEIGRNPALTAKAASQANFEIWTPDPNSPDSP